MLKSTKLAIPISLFLLTVTTACSVSKVSQKVSSGWNAVSTEFKTPEQKMALAKHLKKIGAKEYGTFWCPTCTRQKEMFGEQAYSQVDYIECDPNGKNARPDLCQKANISVFPTWQINGKLYPYVPSLDKLAELSGYKGDRVSPQPSATPN